MIFSIAMGAEYLFYVKSIATFAPTFYGYIISVLASVHYQGFAEVVRKADLPLAGSWQTCPKFVGSG